MTEIPKLMRRVEIALALAWPVLTGTAMLLLAHGWNQVPYGWWSIGTGLVVMAIAIWVAFAAAQLYDHLRGPGQGEERVRRFADWGMILGCAIALFLAEGWWRVGMLGALMVNIVPRLSLGPSRKDRA